MNECEIFQLFVLLFWLAHDANIIFWARILKWNPFLVHENIKWKFLKFKYFNYILTIWLYSGEYFKENWKGKINFLIFTYLALKLKYFGISYVHSFILYYFYKILYKYWNELKKEASCAWVFDNRSNNHINLIMI